MRGTLLRLLPALWAGVLLAIATLAAPAAFATLPTAEAGRVVGWIFWREAWLSLGLAALTLLLRLGAGREGRSLDLALLLAVAACTGLGYFALQPLMAAARSGQGPLSFGQLHGLSLLCFGLKLLCLLALAWRAARRA